MGEWERKEDQVLQGIWFCYINFGTYEEDGVWVSSGVNSINYS